MASGRVIDGDEHDARLLAHELVAKAKGEAKQIHDDVKALAASILSDAREGAWGVVQAEISELDFDFDRYARTHFERLRGAAEQPVLEDWLASAGAEAPGTNTRQERHGPTA